MEAPMATVRTERVEGGIDVITLDRAEHLNSLSYELVEDLRQALSASGQDQSCRAIVLTGAGRAFCAGLDLNEIHADPPGGTVSTVQGKMHRQQSLTSLVMMIPKLRQPVIAAVNGVAVGGGMALTLVSDVRLCAPSARFNAAFIRVGVSGCELGLSWLLPRLVGASKAFEIALTGRFVEAEEADRIGLARVVHDQPVLDAAIDVARQITAHSPFGVWMTKEVMWASLEVGSLSAAVDLENRTQILGLYTEDHVEAVKAFFEKRPPVFVDR
jgi:enoyl-CoA hydratase